MEIRIGSIDLRTLTVPGTLVDDQTPISAFGFSGNRVIRINGIDIGVVPAVQLITFLAEIRTALGEGSSAILNSNRIVISSLTTISIEEPTDYSSTLYSNILHVFGLTKDSSEDYGEFTGDRAIIVSDFNKKIRINSVDLKDIVTPSQTNIDNNTFLTQLGFLSTEWGQPGDISDDGYIRINGIDIGVVPGGSQSLGGFLVDLTNALGPEDSCSLVVSENQKTARIVIKTSSPITITEPAVFNENFSVNYPNSKILHSLGLTKDETEDYGGFTGPRALMFDIPSQAATPKLKIDSGAKVVFNAKVKVL